MRGPMVLLAAGCALIGLAPALLTPVLDSAIAAWRLEAESASLSIGTLAPLGSVGALAVALVAAAALLLGALATRGRMAPRLGTWDCGYARPTREMQYTASSFAQMLVAIFGWVLRPLSPELLEYDDGRAACVINVGTPSRQSIRPIYASESSSDLFPRLREHLHEALPLLKGQFIVV